MIFLSKVSLNKNKPSGFPFSVPSISNLTSIDFTNPVTFLVGENGSGKSTFLESLAVSINSHTIGEKTLANDDSIFPLKPLADSYKLTWKLRTHKGFFLRSEDVFGFTKYLKKEKNILQKDAEFFRKSLSGYGQQLAVGSLLGQKKSFEHRYGEDLNANSHGETFLKVFQSRFVPGGLYLLDEPETPLSFNSQLSFIILLRQMVKQDAQFIIATHSPILTALPEAQILSFNNQTIKPIKYHHIESFNLTREFLNHPEAFIKNL